MSFSFFDHTGDVGVHLDAPSLEALFSSAADALLETLSDPSTVRPTESVIVSLRAAELDLLLVDWLSELLYRFDAHGVLTSRTSVTLSQEDGWHLSADAQGERFDPERHAIKVLVKGITYHSLRVQRSGDGWTATVIFDI